MSTLWDIHPRDANLARTLDPVSGWRELTVVERYNLPDTWTITGPARALSAFGPGMGSILDRTVPGPEGRPVTTQVTSGRLRSYRRSMVADERTGRVEETITAGFVSDLDELATRRVYPDPAHPLTTTMSTFSRQYDRRSGAVETLLLAYVAANLGPAAPIAARRLPSLVLPASAGRGGTTTVSARMDDLGTLVRDLAEAGRLRVRIVHDESTGVPQQLLTVDVVPDVSAAVRFGPAESTATGTVTGWDLTLEAPELTDAIVFAAGEKVERFGARFTDETAVSMWGSRREALIDQRQTDDSAEIRRAAEEALTEGATPVTLDFSVVDGPDVVYRRDYDVGYRVGVELPGLPAEISDNTVREVTTTVRPYEAERVSVVVGTPGATSRSTKDSLRLSRSMRRIDLLSRST